MTFNEITPEELKSFRRPTRVENSEKKKTRGKTYRRIRELTVAHKISK